MGIYWILVGIVCIAGILIQPHLSKKRAKTYLWCVFAMLLLVSGFRAFSVGADTKEYVKVFYNIGNLELMRGRYEIGFLRYVELLHKISNNPGILIIMSSLICIGASCVFTYEFSKSPMLSMMLYILLGAYFSQMNVMRQAIAMSILEVAFMIMLKNRGGYRGFSLHCLSCWLQRFIQLQLWALFPGFL